MQDVVNELLGLKEIPPNDLRQRIERISWDILFLKQAVLSSRRSHDAETKCGCVLVRDNTIIGTGYNGFIHGIRDEWMPNKRPHKYPFMIHAELNAVLNCAKNGVSTNGATAYITTMPCFSCFQMLWQAGINRIVHSNISPSKSYNTKEAKQQIQAMMLMLNQDGHYGTTYNIYMDFIDKKNVLPK